MKIKDIIISIGILLIPCIIFAEDTLPDKIFLKNLSRGFSYEHLYALKDGKIWVRPNSQNTGIEGNWTLFNVTGIPYGKDSPSFKKENSITGFSTEGTMIVAVSDAQRFYFWQPTLKEKTTWADETGSPFADALYLPKNRTWCFSLSLMRAPWKRLTPMHDNDIVSYWEDIDGNRTEFGFTATIYVVDPDGQKIRYTDTGLPPSWHKAFTSPERGHFIIEKISAAASTILVINKTGKMYTRMLDYEMEGGCPALKYTYEHGTRTTDDQVADLMESVRTLPLPDWREQEPIMDPSDPNGKAAITENISIQLTGRGNAARELRVQGRNSDGEYGYWKKAIFGNSWTFQRTDEQFDDSDIIKNYLSDAPRGITLDKTYKGVLKKRGAADLSVELVDFYYYSTPCTLRVHAGEKQFDLKFHTVDMWSPTVQKKGFPELVGNPAGEPKLLQGTIEIPSEILASDDTEIKKVIESYFREFNHVPFAFKVSADDGKVVISSRVIQRELKSNMIYAVRGKIRIELSNTESASAVHADMFYTALANLPILEIPDDWQTLEEADIPRIDALIALNQKSLKEMRNLLSVFRKEHLKAGSVSALGSAAYYIFDGMINLVGLPYWKDVSDDPGISEDITQLGGLSYTGGTPMNEYAMMNLELSSKNPEDYERAVKIFNERISLLGKIRLGLSRKKK
jgi:hypothetical protein